MYFFILNKMSGILKRRIIRKVCRKCTMGNSLIKTDYDTYVLVCYTKLSGNLLVIECGIHSNRRFDFIWFCFSTTFYVHYFLAVSTQAV